MLFNFKELCHDETTNLVSNIMSVAKELKGIKLKRVEQHLAEIGRLTDKLEDKS